MPASKIQDEAELVGWFEDGMTYRKMVEMYREKYDIETVPSMFSNFRARRGLQRRITRNDDLIPWFVEERHRWAYSISVLRMEARQRAGHPLTEGNRERLDSWKTKLAEGDLVLHYDAETLQGFLCVPRREGVDLDLIREPDQKTTQRRAAD